LWHAGRVAGLAVMAGGAAFWFGRFVLASEGLAVDRVVVTGNNRLSDGEVEALVADVRGQQVLRVDFDEYRRRLLDSPWVAGVTLWRMLPSTIEIRVVERVPMAVARVGDQLFLVDDVGIIIDEYGPQYRDFDLPIVDGLVLGGGSTIDPVRARLASRFLTALDARPEIRRRVSQVDVSDARDLVVLLGTDPVSLHLGAGEFVERLQTYLDLAPSLRDQFETMDSVDLRYGARIFVRGDGRTGGVD
jgi:cell division protein FtsQ